MPIVLKSGNLNLLETSGPVQACNGIAVPLHFTLMVGYTYIISKNEWLAEGAISGVRLHHATNESVQMYTGEAAGRLCVILLEPFRS